MPSTRSISALCFVLGVGCADTDHNRCKAGIGCSTNAALTATNLDAARLDEAAVQACRNELCSWGYLPPLPMPGFEVGFLMSGSYGGIAAALLMERDGTCGVDVRINGYAAGGPFLDGDVYRLTVVTRDNAELAARTWVATYSEYDPLGNGCQTCLEVHLTEQRP